jgi:hypothetical protein
MASLEPDKGRTIFGQQPDDCRTRSGQDSDKEYGAPLRATLRRSLRDGVFL